MLTVNLLFDFYRPNDTNDSNETMRGIGDSSYFIIKLNELSKSLNSHFLLFPHFENEICKMNETLTFSVNIIRAAIDQKDPPNLSSLESMSVSM